MGLSPNYAQGQDHICCFTGNFLLSKNTFHYLKFHQILAPDVLNNIQFKPFSSS